MKLVSYRTDSQEHLGLHVNGNIYKLRGMDKLMPDRMNDFLAGGEHLMARAKALNDQLLNQQLMPRAEAFYELLAPVPRPISLRDAYAFRQHVETARLNRGLSMPTAFDQFPVFYFSNHNAVQGPGEVIAMPDHLQELDYELEVAVVIGKGGKNIQASQAHEHMAGLMIMNDFSARQLQREEMQLGLGPAKGKDFCSALGPWLVTLDELAPYQTSPKAGHVGLCYNLEMSCSVNGKVLSKGNLTSMEWTFAEIIERCSYGVELFPGDVIGSGTVGTGCLLELNGTGKLNDSNYQTQWLQVGDIVEMEVTGLGRLTNTIGRASSNFSILDLKK